MINTSRFLLASLGAGVWVVIGGMLMAGAFGYHDMRIAFDAIGLPIPAGLDTFFLHTAVRLIIGSAVAGLYAIFRGALTANPAMLLSAGFSWLLVVLLPYAVIADWGIISWPLAVKLWVWGAGELLIASVIVRLIYRT